MLAKFYLLYLNSDTISNFKIDLSQNDKKTDTHIGHKCDDIKIKFFELM